MKITEWFNDEHVLILHERKNVTATFDGERTTIKRTFIPAEKYIRIVNAKKCHILKSRKYNKIEFPLQVRTWKNNDMREDHFIILNKDKMLSAPVDAAVYMETVKDKDKIDIIDKVNIINYDAVTVDEVETLLDMAVTYKQNTAYYHTKEAYQLIAADGTFLIYDDIMQQWYRR